MTNYERIKEINVEEMATELSTSSYESPIKMIIQEMKTQCDNQVYRAIQNVGVDVDKEELLKALRYDREQYKKGYQAAKREIVHCANCKFYELAEYDRGTKDVCRLLKRQMQEDDFCSYGERKDEE